MLNIIFYVLNEVEHMLKIFIFGVPVILILIKWFKTLVNFRDLKDWPDGGLRRLALPGRGADQGSIAPLG